MEKDKARDKSKDLRVRAEKLIDEKLKKLPGSSVHDIQKILYDLHVRQVELELQNEELQDAQLRLKESLRRYSDLYDFAPVGYFTCDENGTVLEANLTLAALLGTERLSLTGNPFHKFVVREDRDVLDLHLKNIFKSRGPEKCELRLFCKGRQEAHAQLESICVKDLEKGIPRCRTSVSDITDRKLKEKALQESEENYRELVENTNSIIIKYDVNGKITFFNEYARHFFGYSRDEIIGKDVMIIVPQRESSGRSLETLPEDILEKPEEFVAHINQNVLKNGELVWISWRNKAIRDSEGTVIGNLAVGQDITERKLAEDALRASEAELQDICFAQSAINLMLNESLEDAPLELILQKALNIILAVPWLAFEPVGSIHLVEEEPEVLVMKARHNLPEPLKKLCAKVPFGTCLCGQAALTQKNQFADHIDDRHEICREGMYPLGHYARPILFGGRTLGVINIYLNRGHINHKEEEFLRAIADTLAGIIVRKQGEDEKEKLNAQLLQAQKMEVVGQLAGGIAHDFNNILTAIIGYSHLLQMETDFNETLHGYVTYILNSAQRAANLTHALLAFSRNQLINTKPVDINEIILVLEKLLARLIGEDIELSTHLTHKDPVVMADTTHIEQALMNLATNARDAMPDGGSIIIKTDVVRLDDDFINTYGFGRQGNYAMISFSDTGHGMDDATRERIFEPFFTTKEVGKGTGLGLAMVYGIVKQHEGFINVYSEPGRGTTFKIYLPLIKSKVEQLKQVESTDIKGGTETVLVIEDDAQVRDLTRKVLERAGYMVIEAVDGIDAVKVFHEHKNAIDLVILDVIMPKKNGKEVYEDLRKERPDIKVLFTSGYTADIIQQKGILKDSQNFISKPTSPGKLLKTVRDILNKGPRRQTNA